MSNAFALPTPPAETRIAAGGLLRSACLLLALLGAFAPQCARALPRAPQNSSGNPPTQPAPADKIRQYMKFIEQRMNEIREITPDTSDAPAQLRDKMEEVTRLCDNLQDSLQTFDHEHVDLRKQLKDLVPASARWAALVDAMPPEAPSDFPHRMALQAVSSTHELAVRLQSSQEQYFASHK
jgi:hypothetical protein